LRAAKGTRMTNQPHAQRHFSVAVAWRSLRSVARVSPAFCFDRDGPRTELLHSYFPGGHHVSFANRLTAVWYSARAARYSLAVAA